MANDIFSIDPEPADRAEASSIRDADAPAQIEGGAPAAAAAEVGPALCKICGARMSIMALQHHRCDPARRAAVPVEDPASADAIARAAANAVREVVGRPHVAGDPEIAAAVQAADAIIRMLPELARMPEIAARTTIYTTIQTAIEFNAPPKPAPEPAVERPKRPIDPFTVLRHEPKPEPIPPRVVAQFATGGPTGGAWIISTGWAGVGEMRVQ